MLGAAMALLLVAGARAEWQVSRANDFTRDDGVEGDLRAIAFADDMKGWAVGDNSLLLATRDGGRTWARQALPPPPAGARRPPFGGAATPQLWQVVSISPDTAWIVGSGGTLVKTMDGGQTWARVDAGTSNRLVDITFVSKDVGFIVGENETLLTTKDGGATWQSVVSGRRARAGDDRTVFESVAFPQAAAGWVVGSSGTVRVSADGGESWGRSPSGPDVPQNLFGIVFTSPSDGWIVGQEGTLLRTDDGGRTWRSVDNPAQEDYYDLRDVCFERRQTGAPLRAWAVGDGGTILHTRDGGTTWAAEKSGVRDALNAVAVTPSGTVFVAGAWGIILQSASPPKI
jgi:photosystem II stability/assembly factor-like uncharacterized protein